MTLVDALETLPSRFPAFAHNGCRLDGYHKALFAKRYLAILCIEEQMVYLDYVVDSRKDNQGLLEGLQPS